MVLLKKLLDIIEEHEFQKICLISDYKKLEGAGGQQVQEVINLGSAQQLCSQMNHSA